MSDRKITLRGKRVSIFAVHEAGHALVMYATRRAWGWDQPIDHIQMHGGEAEPTIKDNGGLVIVEGAVVSGPSYTPEMVNAAGIGRYDNIDMDVVVPKCRKAGLELEQWARDFILTMMAGPMAEWVYLGKPGSFKDVVEPDDSHGHIDYLKAIGAAQARWGVSRDCDEAGRQLLSKVLSEETTNALIIVEKNRKAISALAVALPRRGTMPGERACEILRAHLPALDAKA